MCKRRWSGGIQAGERHIVAHSTLGLDKEMGMTGAEMYEVLHQMAPVGLESLPSGQGSREGALYHSQRFW